MGNISPLVTKNCFILIIWKVRIKYNIFGQDHQLLLFKNRGTVNQLNHNNFTYFPPNNNSRTKHSFENLYAPVFNPTLVNTFKMFNGQNSQIVACGKITIVGKTFPHLDFVTSVKFRPRDDRFFSYNSHGLITSLTVSNDGNLTIVVAMQGFHSKR